ncbi:hypothetical protein [Ralstonia phage RSP15]|uniref:hypothetical protein n=1 Tax=Ralstonia phage RSP15 TaxID=1785960 RepID=UPI00074D3432|nr:hypothetical protein BH754_gp220 [Ralstonia phage RSP15]BAU40086.1 hypothetical protein [Ralstonia phage RSP15]
MEDIILNEVFDPDSAYTFEETADKGLYQTYSFEDNHGNKYQLLFTNIAALGKRVQTIRLGQQVPGGKYYKPVIKKIGNPFEMIATIVKIFNYHTLQTSKGKLKQGFAFGIPSTVFGAYAALVKKIVARQLKVKWNLFDSQYQVTDDQYTKDLNFVYFVTKMKSAKDVFNGDQGPSLLNGEAPSEDQSTNSATQIKADVKDSQHVEVQQKADGDWKQMNAKDFVRKYKGYKVKIEWANPNDDTYVGTESATGNYFQALFANGSPAYWVAPKEVTELTKPTIKFNLLQNPVVSMAAGKSVVNQEPETPKEDPEYWKKMSAAEFVKEFNGKYFKQGATLMQVRNEVSASGTYFKARMIDDSTGDIITEYGGLVHPSEVSELPHDMSFDSSSKPIEKVDREAEEALKEAKATESAGADAIKDFALKYKGSTVEVQNLGGIVHTATIEGPSADWAYKCNFKMSNDSIYSIRPFRIQKFLKVVKNAIGGENFDEELTYLKNTYGWAQKKSVTELATDYKGTKIEFTINDDGEKKVGTITGTTYNSFRFYVKGDNGQDFTVRPTAITKIIDLKKGQSTPEPEVKGDGSNEDDSKIISMKNEFPLGSIVRMYSNSWNEDDRYAVVIGYRINNGDKEVRVNTATKDDIYISYYDIASVAGNVENKLGLDNLIAKNDETHALLIKLGYMPAPPQVGDKGAANPISYAKLSKADQDYLASNPQNIDISTYEIKSISQYVDSALKINVGPLKFDYNGNVTDFAHSLDQIPGMPPELKASFIEKLTSKAYQEEEAYLDLKNVIKETKSSAASTYTGSHYKEINNLLRGKQSDTFAASVIKELDGDFVKDGVRLSSDTTLYRTQKMDYDDVKMLLEGKQLVFYGYTSMTTKLKMALGWKDIQTYQMGRTLVKMNSEIPSTFTTGKKMKCLMVVRGFDNALVLYPGSFGKHVSECELILHRNAKVVLDTSQPKPLIFSEDGFFIINLKVVGTHITTLSESVFGGGFMEFNKNQDKLNQIINTINTIDAIGNQLLPVEEDYEGSERWHDDAFEDQKSDDAESK